jgi:hypothetical protein
MKQILLCLLYWSYIRPSASFPVEEKPGFTLWPLEKRGVEPLTELQYSGVRGTQLGISVASHFGIPDPTCRGKMPGDGCWTMDQFSVDVSHQTLKTFINITELCRKCSKLESQNHITDQFLVFSIPRNCQVQQKGQLISFCGMPFSWGLLRGSVTSRPSGYVFVKQRQSL